MNEYFQLDFRSNQQVVPGIDADNISLRRESLSELVSAASRFCDDYGDCDCSLWHWKNGELDGSDNPFLGYTVNEFVQQRGRIDQAAD